MKTVRIAYLICGVLLLTLVTMTSMPASVASAEEGEGKEWALLVGISEYRDIEGVLGPAYDAKEWNNLLSPIWGQDNTTLLTNEEATKHAIEMAFEWLVSNAAKEDTVLFYFSGHGNSQGWLAPYNALDPGSWITPEELAGLVSRINAREIIVIIDSCYSATLNDYLMGPGRLILTSSEANEKSWSALFSGSYNGVFSYYLLNAIEEFAADIDGDNQISAEELFAYASPLVVEVTSDFESTQHPVISDQFPNELELVMQIIFATDPDLSSVISYSEIVMLDNQPYPLYAEPRILAVGRDYQLTVLPYIENGDNQRYTFVGWQNGSNEPSITLSQGGTYTAIYKTEYLVTVASDFGQIMGDGWYEAGQIATLSTTTTTTGDGTRFGFLGWSGDISSTTQSIGVEVNGPLQIEANWKTEYLLSINSEYGEIDDAGWYQDGSVITLTDPSDEGVIIRHIFSGWSGDLTITESGAVVVIDASKQIIANWKEDYIQLALLLGGLVLVVIVVVMAILNLRQASTY